MASARVWNYSKRMNNRKYFFKKAAKVRFVLNTVFLVALTECLSYADGQGIQITVPSPVVVVSSPVVVSPYCCCCSRPCCRGPRHLCFDIPPMESILTLHGINMLTRIMTRGFRGDLRPMRCFPPTFVGFALGQDGFPRRSGQSSCGHGAGNIQKTISRSTRE